MSAHRLETAIGDAYRPQVFRSALLDLVRETETVNLLQIRTDPPAPELAPVVLRPTIHMKRALQIRQDVQKTRMLHDNRFESYQRAFTKKPKRTELQHGTECSAL